MQRIKVLIAEDEQAVRDALVDLVAGTDDMAVVGSAGDADEAITVAAETHPDVALVDVKMPGGGGPRAAREIRAACPDTHVVALSAYEDRSTVLEMLRAGVVGYIVKGTPADEILETVRSSMRGHGHLSVEVTADVIHELAMHLERSEVLARELQELDRTKSELIQVLSHELFTPITAIQGFAATVAEHGDRLSAEETRSLAAGVARASGRITRLVGNLAASARLDREGVEIPTGPVEVAKIVSGATGEFESQRGRIAIPPGAGEGDIVWADHDLAVRAIVAVIENALALSPEDSQVQIEVDRPAPAHFTIAVLDRGPGIIGGAKERIFQAFTQGDTSTTRRHQGLGIGLYLAKRIMVAHGGGIDVHDREAGGSVFELTFPAYRGSTATPL